MPRSIRVISRLDIKGTNLIKSIQLEGLRVIGDPQTYALSYYQDGTDEIVFVDAVASLYGRNNLSDIISRAADNVFVPITVGGGIRSVEDVSNMLRAGADKVAINTAAVGNPQLISEIAKKFGSQCVVLSVEAKKVDDDKWEPFTDNGRERSGQDVIEWIKKAVDLGAGEILLTSIDREGTRKGFDIELIEAVTRIAPIPVIASGGMGTMEHISDVLMNTSVDAIAVADAIHYKRHSLSAIKAHIQGLGFGVRTS